MTSPSSSSNSLIPALRDLHNPRCVNLSPELKVGGPQGRQIGEGKGRLVNAEMWGITFSIGSLSSYIPSQIDSRYDQDTA